MVLNSFMVTFVCVLRQWKVMRMCLYVSVCKTCKSGVTDFEKKKIHFKTSVF